MATIERATATYGERGAQYGDTWRNSQFLALKAVLSRYNIMAGPHLLRAIAAAVLVDTKYQRLEGGFKDDSIIDGINYMAFLAEEVRQIDKSTSEKEVL